MKRSVFGRVLAVTMAALFLLSGCGDAQKVSDKKFSAVLEKELGNPPDVVAVSKDFAAKNGNTSADDIWLSGAYKAKVTIDDYPIPYEKYIVNNLGDKKSNYYGSYVLSKDENVTKQMLDNYGQALANSGWTKIDKSEYGVSDDDEYFTECQLFIKGNHAIVIDDVVGPLHWEEDKVLENTTEDYFGTFIYFY